MLSNKRKIRKYEDRAYRNPFHSTDLWLLCFCQPSLIHKQAPWKICLVLKCNLFKWHGRENEFKLQAKEVCEGKHFVF